MAYYNECMSAIHTGDAYRILALELAKYRALSYRELAELADQNFVHGTTLKDESLEVEVTIQVRRICQLEDRILVAGTVGSVDWGGPADRFDDQFVVEPPASNAQV